MIIDYFSEGGGIDPIKGKVYDVARSNFILARENVKCSKVSVSVLKPEKWENAN